MSQNGGGTTSRARVLLVWWAVCGIWSTVWLFIKLGLNDLPPASFAWVRLAVAVLVLLPILRWRGLPLWPRSRREFLFVAVTGFLLLSCNYGFLFWGARYVSSGLTAVIAAATPAFGLVLAHKLIPGERFTLAKLTAVLLGVAGVGVIFLDQLDFAGWMALWGSVAVALSALGVAAAYVLVKAYVPHLNSTSLMTGQMICGLVPLLLLGLAREGNPLALNWTPTAVLCLLYLALAGSVVAFWLNYWLLRRMEATKVMAMSLVEPPLAVLLGALVLGEKLSWRAVAGGALVLVSVALILRARAEETGEGAGADEGEAVVNG